MNDIEALPGDFGNSRQIQSHRRADVGPGEVVALEQKRQVELFGERVGETAAEVQASRTVGPAKAAVSLPRDARLAGGDRDDLHPASARKRSRSTICSGASRLSMTIAISRKLAADMQAYGVSCSARRNFDASGSMKKTAASAEASTTVRADRVRRNR